MRALSLALLLLLSAASAADARTHSATVTEGVTGWRVAVDGKVTIVPRPESTYLRTAVISLSVSPRGAAALIADGRVSVVRHGRASVLDPAAGTCPGRLRGARFVWCAPDGKARSAWLDSRCRFPKRRDEVLIGTHLDVYAVSRIGLGGDERGALWACRRENGRRVRLATGHLDGRGFRWYRSIELAGYAVAISETSGDAKSDETGWRLLSIDGRNGRRVETIDLGGDGGVEPRAVRRLVVSPGGAMAAAHDLRGEPEVVAAGRELDRGAGIDLTSLRLEGDAVQWIRDGELRSAPLRLVAPV